LVQIEAMLCGTPVAAIDIGAVREIVDEGVTGSLANGAGDLAQAIQRALMLDRRRIREVAEKRFSAERMVRDHLRVYETVVES
jgi:glycosyltransferase involved in cell wall biosynthesis